MATYAWVCLTNLQPKPVPPARNTFETCISTNRDELLHQMDESLHPLTVQKARFTEAHRDQYCNGQTTIKLSKVTCWLPGHDRSSN